MEHSRPTRPDPWPCYDANPVMHRRIASPVAGEASVSGVLPGKEAMAWRIAWRTAMASMRGGSPTALVPQGGGGDRAVDPVVPADQHQRVVFLPGLPGDGVGGRILGWPPW